MGTNDSKYQTVLRKLINERQFSTLKLDDALLFFCKTLAEVLTVDRVGVWELDATQSELKAVLQWSVRDGTSHSGAILPLDQLGTYFEEIKSNIHLSLDDAMNDPRCAALAQVYLPQNGISSMLDCPLHNIDKTIGILCIEHIGPKRIWTPEEQDFAVSIASLISFTFENHERLKAEQKFRIQSERLEFYTKLMADWQWKTDANFRLSEIVGEDPELGREFQHVLGLTLWEIDSVDPVNLSSDALKALFEAKGDLDDLIFSVTSLGQDRVFCALSARPIFDEEGEFAGYWGVARNITKGLQSEIDLKASEQKYRTAARLANVGAWVWDEIEGRISYCSPELEKIYAITAEELIARTVAVKLPSGSNPSQRTIPYEKDLGWIHPDDREAYRQVIDDAYKKSAGYETIMRIVRDDGSIRTLHEMSEPVFSEGGQFVATTGVLLDITDQEAQKEALRQSREQLSNLMDNIPGALYRVKNDANWTPVYTSAGFDRLLGNEGKAANSERQRYNNLLKDSDLQQIDAAVTASLKTGASYEFEYPVYRDNAEHPIWLFERGRPICTPSGEVELEGILLDVTAKHAAEEALIQSQRLDAVGQLTGGIAHDFNNLLAVILGNLELLQDEISEPSQFGFVETAIAATLRGADLIKSMLSFARRARLQPTILDLNHSILGVQNWINRTLPENICIRTNLDPELWEIEVDPGSTESLILNLLLNARDAMAQGGKLTIETANITVGEDFVETPHDTLKQGKYVVLTVTDTGHGIPKEIIDRVFEPFFTTKPTGTGTGLGLSMIQGFIKQSGGTVHVYSEQNVGTTFKVYFLASESQANPQELPPRSLEGVMLEDVKILLAEDEVEVANIIAQTLGKLGCSVTIAADGHEALALFQARPDFDLLLTDIVMPGELMGTHLAKAIRALRPDLPVIFMSGYANEALVHGNGLQPEDIRLSKPVSRADLVQAVERILKSKQPF